MSAMIDANAYLQNANFSLPDDLHERVPPLQRLCADAIAVACDARELPDKYFALASEVSGPSPAHPGVLGPTSLSLLSKFCRICRAHCCVGVSRQVRWGMVVNQVWVDAPQNSKQGCPPRGCVSCQLRGSHGTCLCHHSRLASPCSSHFDDESKTAIERFSISAGGECDPCNLLVQTPAV